LLALKEIEFDRATGKLSDDDYAALKAKYSKVAIAAIEAEEAEELDMAAEDVAEELIKRAAAGRADRDPRWARRSAPTAAVSSPRRRLKVGRSAQSAARSCRPARSSVRNAARRPSHTYKPIVRGITARHPCSPQHP
jgi:hypothetical protein